MTRLGRGAYDLTFRDALREAVAERGLSLARLSSHLDERGLHVGVSTLSTWQSGQRVPREGSARVLAALEDLLQVPPGWLLDRVAPARVDAVRPRRPYRVAENAATLVRLLEELGTGAHGAVRTLGVLEELVMAGTSLGRRNVAQSVRAVRATDRILIIAQCDEPADVLEVVPEAVSGCRVGRVARDAGDGSLVAELLLDRRLEVGETALVRYAVHDGSGSPLTSYLRLHEWLNAHATLEVAFAPDALPVRVTEFHRPREQAPDEVVRELTLTPDRRAHVVVPATTPGAVGLRWEWADPS